MKKTLLILLCLALSLLSIGCATEDIGENNKTSSPTSSATTPPSSTTGVPTTDAVQYEQPPIQAPLEDDKYPTVSHITIYKNQGMRYDITDRNEIKEICDYYKAVSGEFSETVVSISDLPGDTDREIRFFTGGYKDEEALGFLILTSERYILYNVGGYNVGGYDIYIPTESDAEAYKNYFDEIFASQKQPYKDVYTR